VRGNVPRGGREGDGAGDEHPAAQPISRHNWFLESSNRAPSNSPSWGLAEGTWRANPGLAPLKSGLLNSDKPGGAGDEHLDAPSA
jgi:hypothetical protein